MPKYTRAFIPGGTLFYHGYTIRTSPNIHYNSVKHSYVTRVRDWTYSSFHRQVGHGIYNLDSAADDDVRLLEME